MLLVATVLNWYWMWGMFFLYWAIAGIVLREAFVVQPVTRHEHPVLFWIISGAWLVLAALTIYYDLIAPWLMESPA